MFITKKKFAEAIEKAVAEREHKIWTEQRFYEMERDMRSRMDNLERRVFTVEEAAGLHKNSIGFEKVGVCKC